MGVALREIKVCSAVGVLELTRSWAVNVNDGARDDRGDGEENEEHEGDEEDSDEEDEEEGSGEEDSDMDSDEFHSVDSGSSTPSSTSSFDRARHLSPLTLAIPPDELTDTFPTAALLHILSSARSSTHLHLAYTEPLLAHDPRIASALAALPSITHIVFSQVGPLGCELLQNLQARLEDVQVDFDDTWVASIITASFAKPSPDTIVPSLPNGESSGLPTPVPTPATTPAAPASGILPDPVPLLAHSMGTLKTLRASNAIIVTVADKLRYPFVRTLSLRLAGVPTVTPLVHAFPGVADMYVYTPFDGCGVRAPAPTPPSPESPTSPTTPTKPRKRRLRPPMPSLDATREANRTSQLYSSFPPLACVRGFAPGLYALGLTCAISRLEVGAVSVDGREAEAVRKLLVDTSPRSVSVGLSRGWWAPRTSTKGKEREALRTMFGGDGGGSVEGADGSDGLGSGGEAWAGLSELVVRVEEPGRWADVTTDLLAMLLPLTSTLTTFVLHWDRTSVPFDRVPPDDDALDDIKDSDSSHMRSSRAETFVRRIAEQMPLLRYMFIELIHDAPPPHPARPPHAPKPFWIPTGTRRVERRYWRVDRSDGWLCLDPLGESAARQVLDAEGLSFEDRVRYHA
ncbi:hypothetical protein C8Q76DRAFT_804000 [Earliella scabrosa]|nr:hypothetical protein C8Q76DRAFT_804000 [Earliella scabrosa]